MKRIMCILLSALMFFGLFPLCVVAEEPDIKVAIADVFSSEYSYDTCKVYLVKDKWLMDISDVSRYTRTSLSNSQKTVLLTHGTRNITIDISNGKVSEDGISFNIETYQMGNKTLIHAYPILTYLGAECDIEDSHLVINMPQSTIWEGLIRSSNENYFALETFGGELEQNTRLILNGILKILESGLSGALFDNAMKDALIEAMQIDPLKYNGSWEIKEKTDERYGSMISAMIAANDFSPDFNEVFDRTESLITNIAIEYLIGANEDDALYVIDLKGTKGLFEVVSTASSFLSNLSTNSKCTSDSLAMVKAFSKHTTKYSKYYLAANSVQSKVESELSSALDAARDVVKEKIADEFVGAAYEQLGSGITGYIPIKALIEGSVNISVMLHKLIYGENNAFAYSSAETNAINLLMFKNELLKDMDNLGKKILSDNYTNEQDIEDYRLLNVLYYRILIAANEQLEDMIVAQERENEADMKAVIDNLHKNNDIFSKNLYRLTISKGEKFVDTKELSKSNSWDNFEELKSKATEPREGNDLAMYYLSIQSGQYAISGDYKYLTIRNGNNGMEPTGDLYKVNLTTGEKALIKKDTLAQCINVVGDKIFYTQYGGGPFNVGVHMISTDGSGYKKLTDEYIHTLVADESYVYYAVDYTYDPNEGIKRIAYDSSASTEETIIPSISGFVYDMCISNSKLIYSEVKTVVDKNTRIVVYDLSARNKTIINDGDDVLENFEEIWTNGEYIYILKWHEHSSGQGVVSDVSNVMRRDLYRYSLVTEKYEVCELPIASYDKIYGYCIGDIYSGILDDFGKELPTDFSTSIKYVFSSVI
ncbi:MAG: hypothetical protein E7549_05380 [Ruminococcaceae bacterium]|nr:hypothetical protein [Oscillospiraceae bacterium]